MSSALTIVYHAVFRKLLSSHGQKDLHVILCIFYDGIAATGWFLSVSFSDIKIFVVMPVFSEGGKDLG